MRNLKAILLCFLLSFSAALSASYISCVGIAKQVENGRDTLFLFRDEIHLKADTVVDWYRADGSLFQSEAEEVYPDDGGYYIVRKGVQSAPVYVFLYTEPIDLAITLTPDCETTVLTLTGDTKPFSYTRPDGSTGSYARACTIDYNALAWNTEAWVDSAAQISTTLQTGNYFLPALYGPTPVTLCYDAAIRAKFDRDSACLSTQLTEEDIRAVKIQLTSLVTAREDDPLGNNERNRPTSQDLIVGSEYSGPLEVAFYSNPTPGAQYFTWHIYQGSDLVVTWRDKDIRYTFSAPGNYNVVCSANNAYCTSDSMEVAVVITESYIGVPNVFTPNDDKQNDEFRVAYRSLREFHIWVYNRWGKLVYESTDPDRGWDGTINGRKAAAGAYYYVIRAKGTDAPKNAEYIGLKAVYKKKKANTDKSVNRIYQLSGDINLIR